VPTRIDRKLESIGDDVDAELLFLVLVIEAALTQGGAHIDTKQHRRREAVGWK
jgi:hypothetical protein